MDFNEVYQGLKLSTEEYNIFDISSELYRDISCSFGTMRIDNPVALIQRKGGLTHRVVDSNGEVFIYAAPESGNTIVSFGNRCWEPCCKF